MGRVSWVGVFYLFIFLFYLSYDCNFVLNIQEQNIWGSLTMTSTGKFVYIAHHFILLRLSPFGLRVDREGWWFEHSMS